MPQSCPCSAVSHAVSYYVNGYTTPAGINSKTEVKRIQAALGVKQDGVWGAQTQAAWSAQSQGNISMPKTQAAVSQQAQVRPDYAVSGFTPPSGVTNRQMVRSIQANLGVKQDGVWGSKTQVAGERQDGDLWQKDSAIQQISSKGYIPPKGIDGSEEIKQVQQRLRVKVNGIWGKDTQEAWDKMRSPQTAYKAPKGIDSEEEGNPSGPGAASCRIERSMG